MLLDSNFLIALERELDARRAGPARRFLAAHKSAPLLVSVVSVGEIAAGMSDNAQARRFFTYAGWRVVRLFPELALHAATIDRDLMLEGQRLGENDNWLAGTALYYGAPIVSNDADFDRVPGLRRLDY